MNVAKQRSPKNQILSMSNPANKMPPLKKVNDWSCALATVGWALSSHANIPTQDEIIERYRSSFPAWKEHPGFTSPWEMLKLMDLLGFPAVDFLATKSLEEADLYMRGRSHHAAFYVIRYLADGPGRLRRADHAMGVIDLNPTTLLLMEPDKGTEVTLNAEQHRLCEGTVIVCSQEAVARNQPQFR